MAYAIKYAYAFHKSKNSPITTDALKPKWMKKRTIGFALILTGTLITILGCAI